jgi:uncharacterized membrane protein
MRALAGIAGAAFMWVTVWSVWRFAVARDPIAEVSAGVWWVGGMMFCGALIAFAITGARGASGQQKGKH